MRRTDEGEVDGGMRVLRADGRAAAPWSNGGGVTREVAVRPRGAAWDTFDWRVSLADVTRDGPYSPLPGIRRILTVVDGAGVELTVDGSPHRLPGRFRPFAFSGAAPTGCRLLDGPIVNLNVMLREGRAGATVEIVRGAGEVPPEEGREVLVVALEGSATVTARPEGPRAGDASRAQLGRFDAGLLPERWSAVLRTEGVAAVITLTAGGAGV
ncbi:HutD/Ves family protein [Streptomyces pinistramenti]|uniref:HutD/Ves family protein n=1 Tax=Streptomyces pinistramenti TaxID=2884812 RepID=UPI001D085EFA|nr:HutD family protein [Streptomyces pinistramenti]MCB5908714.1 HutD family protein [Streptomyces pinistramenti]